MKERFLTAFNALMSNREELILNCRLAQQVICDFEDIDRKLAELQQEVEIVTELSRKAINENSRTAANQDEFNDKHSGYMELHRKATERISELEAQHREQQSKFKVLEQFIRNIEHCPLVIEEFDEGLWVTTVDTVTVEMDGGVVFRFKDGTEIEG